MIKRDFDLEKGTKNEDQILKEYLSTTDKNIYTSLCYRRNKSSSNSRPLKQDSEIFGGKETQGYRNRSLLGTSENLQ